MFLLKLFRIKEYFRKIEDHIDISDKMQSILDLFKLLFLIIYIAHICGCVYHFLGIYR